MSFASLRAGVVDSPGRVADNGAAGYYVFRDHGARADGGSGANAKTRKDGCSATDTGTCINPRPKRGEIRVPAARLLVVGEGDVGTDENIVTDPQTIPQLHSALDGDPVTHDDVIFDQAVGADVAVMTYRCSRENDDELPNLAASTDGRGLDVGQGMDEICHVICLIACI